MSDQPLGSPHLVIPRKASGTVGSELDIIRWVSIDKIAAFQLQLFQIAIREQPWLERLTILSEVDHVINRLVGAKGNVEFTAAIEAAEAVKAGAIQIVEKLGRFRRVGALLFDQLIEPLALFIEECFLVARFNCDLQSPL